MPNWVGYLITEYSPGTRLLVYDYAVGGDNVDGVRKQVQVNFLPRVGEKPSWAPWSAEDTLFGKLWFMLRPVDFEYGRNNDGSGSKECEKKKLNIQFLKSSLALRRRKR